MGTDAFTPAQRRLLAEAWRLGGCQILGLQMSKLRPHFSVKDYAAAVKVAREELGDDTDYSTFYDAPKGGDCDN